MDNISLTSIYRPPCSLDFERHWGGEGGTLNTIPSSTIAQYSIAINYDSHTRYHRYYHDVNAGITSGRVKNFSLVIKTQPPHPPPFVFATKMNDG